MLQRGWYFSYFVLLQLRMGVGIMIYDLREKERKIVVGGGTRSQCSVWAAGSAGSFQINSMSGYQVVVWLDHGMTSSEARLACGSSSSYANVVRSLSLSTLVEDTMYFCDISQGATITSDMYSQGHYCYLY